MSKIKKVKIKSVEKKLLAIIFLIITILGTVQPIFAATVSISGTTKWVAGQFDSKIYTTDSKTDVGMIIRRLTNNSNGERITTFCAEHFIESPTRFC